MIVLTNNKIRQNVMTTSIYVVLNWVSEIKFVVHSVQTYWQKKETKVNRKKTECSAIVFFPLGPLPYFFSSLLLLL